MAGVFFAVKAFRRGIGPAPARTGRPSAPCTAPVPFYPPPHAGADLRHRSGFRKTASPYEQT
ncbi:hypothetical protein GLA29479_1172 [Lysobacter antibioticus]|nr:hypothetical protein GLA29479_1172 [Lysobacter antibioticus]